MTAPSTVLPYRYTVWFTRTKAGPEQQMVVGFAMPKHHDDIQRQHPDLYISRIEIAREQS